MMDIGVTNDLDSTFSGSSSKDKIVNTFYRNIAADSNAVHDPVDQRNWSSSQATSSSDTLLNSTTTTPSAPSPGLVLFNSEDQSDLIFIVTMDSDSEADDDNLQFPGHSFIIKDSSPIFKDIVQQIDQRQRSPKDKKLIINVQCRPETLHNLMSYIYKKEVVLNSVTACLALLDLSIKFVLTELTSICLTFLCNNLTQFNVLLVLSSLRKIDFKPFQSTRSSKRTNRKHNRKPLNSSKPDNNNNNHDESDNLNSFAGAVDDNDDNTGDNCDSRSVPRVARSSSITSVICLSTEGQQSLTPFGGSRYHEIKTNHFSGSNEIIENLVNELISRCYCVLDEFAESILSSEAICNLDRDLLVKILSRDTLKLSSELIAFQAIERWSVSQCQRQLMEINGPNKISLLGDAIYSVRYLTMPLMVFMRGPFASDILTEMDKNYLQSKILDDDTRLPAHLTGLKLDVKRKWTKQNAKAATILTNSSSSSSKSLRSQLTPSNSKKSSSPSPSSTSDSSSNGGGGGGCDRKKKPAIKKFLNGLGDVMIFAIRIFD